MVLVLVVVAASVAIFHERHSFTASLGRIGVGPMVASLLCGMVGVAATYPVWSEVLRGLDVRIPWGSGARVFFVSQLGKYLPGSVWPVLLQMEAGRSRGANRRTMLAANLVTIVLSCCVGLVVAALLLPFSDSTALTHYWWALFAVPLLLALLHPRALPALLDLAFRILRRPPLAEQLELRSELRASGWSVVSWIFLGAHLAILCIAVGPTRLSTFALCTGGMALGFSLGVLFIPAPAGAGIRDVILTLVLGAVLRPGPALATVVASRGLLIVTDVLLAGLAAAFGGVPGRPRGSAA